MNLVHFALPSILLCGVAAGLGQDVAAKAPASQPAEALGVARLQAEAQRLREFVQSPLAKDFLAATAELPRVGTRVIYRDRARDAAWSEAAAAELSEQERTGLSRLNANEQFYYYTRYGSPLAYVRVIELLAKHGVDRLGGKRVVDYGYGSIGHLRLMASLGADVTGIDVDPVLRELYSDPADQGAVAAAKGAPGKLTLVHGSFPGDDVVRAKAGQGVDVFTSKNTLKRGYVHPERPADPRLLVHLGVEDEVFLKTLFDMLKPGGRVMIYNLSPAPSKPDEPYLPWSDGRCPFPREMFEQAGFRVIAYDEDDSTPAREMGKRLGWDQGDGAMDLQKDLFAHYTLLEKP